MYMQELKSKTDYLSPQLRNGALFTYTCVCVYTYVSMCRYMCVCIVLYNDYIHCDLEVCAVSLLIQYTNRPGFFPFRERHVNTGPKINFSTDFCTNLQKMLKVSEGKPDWVGVISSWSWTSSQ